MKGWVTVNGVTSAGDRTRSPMRAPAATRFAAAMWLVSISAAAQTPRMDGPQRGLMNAVASGCDTDSTHRSGALDTARDSARGVGRVVCDSASRTPRLKSAAGVESRAAADPVVAAAHEYARTGVARTVDEGAFETFPYGHAQPTVTCAPLRACVIELESGESVLSKIAGDTQRWEIQLALAGTDGRTSLVVVKPHDCGLTTNLVLATTAGRIYDLTLDSPPCPRSGVNPHGVYVRHVRFYYPDAMVEAWSAPPPVPIAQGAANIGAFNFAYRVTRERHIAWVPIAVFDDGAHCYIKLPPGAVHREAPALFALADDGSRILLNYNLVGDSYVTDRVFRTAVLVVGEAGRERVVRLDNLRYDATVSADDAAHGDGPVAPLGRDR